MHSRQTEFFILIAIIISSIICSIPEIYPTHGLSKNGQISQIFKNIYFLIYIHSGEMKFCVPIDTRTSEVLIGYGMILLVCKNLI